MIKNFNEIKGQLRELAEIINSFKSEAVQLRLVEMVFEATESHDSSKLANGDEGSDDRKGSRRRAPRVSRKASKQTDSGSAKAKAGRTGGKAMLDRLLGEGFFKKPITINRLVEHCAHNVALKYKQSDFSGPLGRLTRDGKLKRTKNADKQYEYSQA